MHEKLDRLEHTYDDLTQQLADPEVLADNARYTEANKALAEISHVVGLYREFKKLDAERRDAEEMLEGLSKADELYDLAMEERDALAERLEVLDGEIQ